MLNRNFKAYPAHNVYVLQKGDPPLTLEARLTSLYSEVPDDKYLPHTTVTEMKRLYAPELSVFAEPEEVDKQDRVAANGAALW